MSFYENHSFDKELPIIFHLDQLELPSHEKCISNWHENIEVIYCIEGAGRAVINSAPAELKKGSLLLINSGEIHYIVSDTPKMKYYCLIIDAVFLKEFGIHVEHTSFSRDVTDSCGRAFFDKIVAELAKHQAYYHAVVKGEILSYAAHLCRNYTCERTTHGSNDRIKKGLIYIREHYTEDLTVEQIAQQAGFSRYYFSRQFKEVTGLTVMKYVEFLRCRHARELLSEGASVSKATVESGFSDVSYFTKVFKHQYGILPSKAAESKRYI